ncbi:unnamed protein product, partial [Diamesa hyperborea]
LKRLSEVHLHNNPCINKGYRDTFGPILTMTNEILWRCPMEGEIYEEVTEENENEIEENKINDLTNEVEALKLRISDLKIRNDAFKEAACQHHHNHNHK